MDKNLIWLFYVIVGVLIVGSVQYLIFKFLRHIDKQNQLREQRDWKAQIGKIFRLPLTALLWFVGSLYLVDMIGTRVDIHLSPMYLSALRRASLIGSITWIFYRWKREIERSILTNPERKIDLSTIRIISRLSTVAGGVIAALLILQIFGVNIAPLLAFGSIGAASIGLAGKDVMANLCSGIMLQITRPFVIGDNIYLPEKGLEGTIEDIGWFRTSIRDKEKRAVYLPNNFFSTMLVVNTSRMTHRHIKQSVKVGFKDISKMADITHQMRQRLENFSSIDKRCPIHVFLKSFGEYACEIEIEAYSLLVDQDAFNKLQQQILLDLQDIMQKNSVNLAVPIMHWADG